MQSPGDPSSLNGTAWVLSSLAGRPALPGAAATMHFEAGRAYGTDGCNRFNAAYAQTGPSLRVDPSAAVTGIACPQDVMAQADAFMRAVAQVRSHRVADGKLVLLAGDGTALATFARQSTSLAGTSWRVTGLNNGRQAVVGVATGTTLTMEFSAGNRVSGSAGCNRYTGTYKADGRALTFGPVGATRMNCAKPDGVMEQEQQFLKAMAMVATAWLDADRLDLRTADDALAFTLSRAPAAGAPQK